MEIHVFEINIFLLKKYLTVDRCTAEKNDKYFYNYDNITKIDLVNQRWLYPVFERKGGGI